MENDQAYQGEGKKRRSFLPAPKKSSGVSPTSPQPSSIASPFQQEYTPSSSSSGSYLPSAPPSASNPASSCKSSSPSVATDRDSATSPYRKSQQADSSHSEKRQEEPVFGKGLRVGARIKIGGVKPGILRYLGTTHLAPGIFCGIELFDPDGNHDGEVNGHRYFSCRPNHGIFAPKEKVCLDTSTALGRLSSDSEGCYSSTESLSERTQKAFRSYEEGELEAVDCSKLSPILSPQDSVPKYSEESSQLRQARLARLASKSRVYPAPEVGDLGKSSESLESQEYGESRKYKSGLPRKSGLPTATTSLPKAQQFSRTYTKYEEGHSYRRTSHPSQSSDAGGHRTDSDQDQRTGGARSSEDSEEDSLVRDGLSTGIKKQLRADSRQYLNFTFDQEELNQAVEGDDSESEIARQARHSANHENPTNPLYANPRFIRDISGDSSDESLGVLSPGINSANNLYQPQQFMKVESGSVVKEELVYAPVSSQTGTQHAGLKSDSYTVVPDNGGSNMSLSSSETDGDVTGLSVTHSISDSDLPPELLPTVEEGTAQGLSAGYGACNERLPQGGYGFKLSGDGSSGGVNLTQTPDSRKSESYTIAQEHTGSDTNQSHSYTVCSHDEPPRDSKRKDRDVMASQSYTISKSDSATSSPSRKYRKISSSSSANEGGDSSSSGTEPKTDSSGENKGDNLDDSSTGVSPEVSQALEWDYGQEFDGKIPISQQDSTMTTSASTGTSESLSDVLRDMSEHSDGFDGENLAEDSDQFEPPDNDFENIDSLEDFPIFGKDAVSIMTDSGISDKDFEFCPNKSSSSTVCGNSSDECSREDDASSHTTTRAISSDSSQETLAAEYVADTPGSIEDKEFLSDDVCSTIHSSDIDERSRVDSFGDGNSNSPASVVSVEEVRALHEKTLLSEDMEECTERERHYSSHEDVSSSTDTSVLVNDVVGAKKSPMETSQDRPGTDGEGEAFDSEGRALNRKERPISLISSTSADTGYVPDTDSELGTLTTNSPDDWVDKLGITHPTSFAPLMETDTMDMDVNDVDLVENLELSDLSAAPVPCDVLVTKASDDDDYCSDLTSATEDDRIEADQVYGPENAGTKVPASRVGGGEGGENKDSETAPESPRHEDQEGDEDTPMDTTGTPEKEEEEEKKDNKSSNKEASNQDKKGRGRKPIKITRKRSENVDHKLPDTTKVTSRLADYIKAPPPVKPKEDKEKEQKKKLSKNARNAIQKRMSVTEISHNKAKMDINSRASSVDRAGDKRDASTERKRVEKPEPPKPIIKRTPPKSKWGNIMNQIEANKDVAKPKPKSEIKSSLAAYLNAPLPQAPTSPPEGTDVTVNMVKNDQPPKREVKSRIKPLPPPPPKIDLSKVKSKLNVPTAASVMKAVQRRDSSPAGKSRVVNKASRDASPVGVNGPRKDSVGQSKRMSDGHIVLVRQSLVDTVSSAKSSRTDLSVCDSESAIESKEDEEASPSKRGSLDVTNGRTRRLSTNSVKSNHSEKPRSRRDSAKSTTDSRPNKANVKSTIPPFTPVKLPSRAVELRMGDGSAASSARSSPTPVIVKPIKPKPKSSPTPAKPAWGSSKPPPPPTALALKGRNSGGNRKPRVNGSVKASATTTTTNHARTTSTSGTTGSASQKEIVRLESLCESRTKELTHTKMQLKATTQGFDAMAILVNYCCAELNAFECPELAKKLETVQKQLTDCLSQIADLTAQKESLDQNLSQVTQEKEEVCKKVEEALSLVEKGKEEHARHTQEMDQTHNSALTTQRDELSTKHEEALRKLHQYYDKQLELMKQAYERQMADMKNEGKLEMNGIRISHLEEIQELRNKHDSQMEELHKQHRNKLEDITHRFESIKMTLSEKVESLRGECEDLRHRARNSEEALQRDADVKVQMALAPYLSLPKEIESLKTVLEMRNEEIQKLRSKNMDLEKQLEEIPIAREKIISLQQKVENLEAIINIKTDHEKQMHEKCQVLMRKYDRESKANKRLSMDYEQVMWRMSQSAEFGSTDSLTKRYLSRSPPRSEGGSPDPRRRAPSPSETTHNDVVLRVKKRSSHSVSEGDRRLRSRSATFVVEKESSDSHSPSSSPQPKQKRWRKKSQTEDVADESERMCYSAGAEILLESQHRRGPSDAGANAMVEEPQGQMVASDMGNSYSKSLSGVSDSGVYDSLTRSDMLNSSIVSTDSEFGTSINLSMNLNSTVEDVESGPPAGDYNSLSDTTLSQTRESSSEMDSGHTSSSNARNGSVSSSQHQVSADFHNDYSKPTSSTYQFQVSVTDDNVFTEDLREESHQTLTDTTSAKDL